MAKPEAECTFYVAKVLDLKPSEIYVHYMRKSSLHGGDTYVFPLSTDKEWISPEKMVGILKILQGSATKRLASLVKVTPPLTCFNMR